MIKLHLGDIGITFNITIKDGNCLPVDISTATSKIFNFKKPDDTILTVNGTFSTDGTDGILFYNTASGDLNLIGLWSLQVNIITPTQNYNTNIYDFRIERNI